MPPAPELIRIATRKSPLALWQAEYVAARLSEAHPGLKTELVQVTTRGDRILDSPLAKVGGKGLFVKELELALEDDRADIAVHSLKDIPVELPPGFHLAAVLARDDPRDAFVSNRYSSFQALPRHARIGTSSLRRQCQVKRRYPDGDVRPLRGNVNTRLEKLDAGEYDAVILAVAGLRRLGFARRITEALSTDILLPAIGQGAIGIEGRLDDRRSHELVSVLHDPESAVCVTAERAMNHALRGGCQVPVAGYAVLDGEQVLLRGLVGSSDGTEVLYAERRGCARDAEALGRGLAADLLERGADRLLKQILADQ